jgi:hypothetical protein
MINLLLQLFIAGRLKNTFLLIQKRFGDNSEGDFFSCRLIGGEQQKTFGFLSLSLCGEKSGSVSSCSAVYGYLLRVVPSLVLVFDL